MGQYLVDYCTRLVANSEASAEPLRRLVPAELLAVVPNGIDISPFRERSGSAQPDRTVVAMVGNLSAQTKKHALFIDAATLTDSQLPVEWRIYGHNPSHGALCSGSTTGTFSTMA